MKILKELSKIITNRKIRNIEIMDSSVLKRKKSKLNTFYYGLMKERFTDDDTAALYIYNSTSTDERYRQLKTRFQKRLLNTLFFLEIKNPSKPDYKKALINCEREWALARILEVNEAFHATHKMARNVFKTASQYHFTHLIIESACLLRRLAALKGDKPAFETYNKCIHEYLPKREAETRSEELLQLVNQQYSQKNTEPFLTEITSYCDQLLSLSERFDAPLVNYNMFLVWMIRYELQQEYEPMLEVCEQAEQYLNMHPYFYTVEKAAPIQIKKMAAYLHTKAFQGGKVIAEKSLDTVPEGSQYWFVLLEYYLLTAIHTENYISALAIYNRAAAHKNFSDLSGNEANKWQVFESYLHYFIEIKQLKSTISYRRRVQSFNLDRFLNEQFTYPKELVNLKVQLITAQILFLLERKNLRQITNKVIHLRKYALPHLKRYHNERGWHFVRLLLQLIRSDFQIDSTIYKSRHLKNLRDSHHFYKGRVEELEVIPYDQCWEKITTYLAK